MEPTCIPKAIENGTFYGTNVNNIRGRFNSNRRGNSNYNNKNTRQGQYYSINNSENKTVGNKDKWEHETNSLDNSGNILNCTIWYSIIPMV